MIPTFREGLLNAKDKEFEEGVVSHEDNLLLVLKVIFNPIY